MTEIEFTKADWAEMISDCIDESVKLTAGILAEIAERFRKLIIENKRVAYLAMYGSTKRIRKKNIRRLAKKSGKKR